jgi:hypothetical protein
MKTPTPQLEPFIPLSHVNTNAKANAAPISFVTNTIVVSQNMVYCERFVPRACLAVLINRFPFDFSGRPFPRDFEAAEVI